MATERLIENIIIHINGNSKRIELFNPLFLSLISDMIVKSSEVST
jgi:hypothetical protein